MSRHCWRRLAVIAVAAACALSAPAQVAVENEPKPARDVTADPGASLVARPADGLRIQTGPILGAFGSDWFSVTCRTNIPARVQVLGAAGWSSRMAPIAESPEGIVHRLRVPIPDMAAVGFIAALGNDGSPQVKARISFPRMPPPGEKFAFVALGDNRSNPQNWATVSAAALKQKPLFVVSTGDLVANGLDDAQWDAQFWEPAKELLADVPFYAVIGNHEAGAPVFDDLIYAPTADGRGRNWSQAIGGALLIGIEGTQSWAAESDNAKWLEKTLAESKAKFIFLFSHYPAWSSSAHGKLGVDGRPAERMAREGREVIMPLLAKYRATAMVAGHDHCYERSEPDGGVTAITTGGAGAPTYPKSPLAAAQNPYSLVFVPVLHYCLFEIAGDTCAMKAITPEGETLDTRTWKAR